MATTLFTYAHGNLPEDLTAEEASYFAHKTEVILAVTKDNKIILEKSPARLIQVQMGTIPQEVKLVFWNTLLLYGRFKMLGPRNCLKCFGTGKDKQFGICQYCYTSGRDSKNPWKSPGSVWIDTPKTELELYLKSLR